MKVQIRKTVKKSAALILALLLARTAGRLCGCEPDDGG